MTDRTNARPEAPPHNRVATRAAAQDPWQAVVLTLFPDLFPGPLGASLTGKALQDDLWRLSARDIRAHGIGRHKNV
ncbi:MAG: tRNA (guanosine(37)-N1)-methyltransferase TrmD, partial [Pseudomonadota bacterium]